MAARLLATPGMGVLALVLLLACSSTERDVDEHTSGSEEPQLSETPPEPTATHATWHLRTRYRLLDSDPWRELEPSWQSGPLATEVTVSGGHDIGEMGRWLGCDFAIAGERATISCGDLTTRSQSEATVRCNGEETIFRFNRAEPLEGGVEIHVKCERGVLD